MEKEIYQAPLIEVDEIKVENGFAASNAGGTAPGNSWDELGF